MREQHNARTQRTYKTFFTNKISPVIGDMDIKNIKPGDIVDFFKKNKMTWTTASTVKSILSGMFTYAVELREVDYNPVTRAVRLKKDSPTIKPFPKLKVKDMIEFLNTTPESRPEYKLAYMLAAFCGLRRSEIYALNKEDFTNGMVFIKSAVLYCQGNGTVIEKPKRDKERAVPVPDFVYEAIPEGSGLLFKKRIVPKDVNSVLRDMCLAKRIEVFTIHSLRHWYATSQLEGGIDLPTVSAAMGHSNIATTQMFYVDKDSLVKSRRDKIVDVYSCC